MKLSYRSFAAGEVSRRLGARVDQVKYQTGAYTMRNMVSTLEGAAQNRSGFGYVRPCHNFTADNPPRLLPFVFSDDQSYVIVLEENLLSVISQAEPQLDAGTAIASITQGAICRITTTGPHNLSSSNLAWVTGVGGMEQINNRFFRVIAWSATEIDLYEENGNGVDSTGYDAFTAGGTVQELSIILTPWSGADLRQIRVAQSADVMFFAHPDYPLYKLTRTAGPTWTLDEVTFEPDITAPLNGTIGGTGGAATVRYQVTAVSDATLEESFAGMMANYTATLDLLGTSSPYRVTKAAHGHATGDRVTFFASPGPANGNTYSITVTGANTYTLDGTDDLGVAASYVLTQTVALAAITSHALVAAASGTPITVGWTAVDGALEYNVYREVNGVFGYIGTAATTSFVDLGYDVDPFDTPPIDRDPFSEVDDYPAAVGLFQQRLLLAGSRNNPERADAGRIGLFYNFTKSNPIQADDAFSWVMRSNQVQGIRHILEMSRCLVFTQSSVFTLEGNEAGSLVPTAINPRKRAEHGLGDVAPIPVGNAVIYVQAFGKVVREILPGSGDDFNAKDLTVYARHLFDRNSIISWSYAEEPSSIAWAVRDDGTMLGFTYLREHEVAGWHRHDTGAGDQFMDVCSVPEGAETATYAVVRRFGVGLGDRFYIERMATRQVAHQADGRFLDSYRYHEDENEDGAAVYTLEHDGLQWLLSASGTAPAWVTGDESPDIGRIIMLRGPDGERIWCTVGSFAFLGPDTFAVVSVRTDIPGAFDDDTGAWQTAVTGPATTTNPIPGSPSALFPDLPLATADWSQSVDEITDLWHLEGRGVRVVGDGYAQGPFVVTDGAITLASPAVQVVSGLQVVSDLVTLEPDSPEQTWTGKTKTVSEIDVRLEESDGVLVGTSWATLAPWSADKRLDRPLNVELQPYTGTYRAQCGGLQTITGRTFIRQKYGLPTTILGVYPSMEIVR